jgi:mannose-6-phosphate isomerase-like protein (cupin superfamily)
MTSTDREPPLSPADVGGDPPCWAHLFDAPDAAADAAANAQDGRVSAVVVDLGAARVGVSGAIWSLPHGGDLDANLVRLDAHEVIACHVNHEVDVLLIVQSGAGQVTIDGVEHELRADVLVLVPSGVARAIAAGPMGITYISIHRRRGPLTITSRPPRLPAREAGGEL